MKRSKSIRLVLIGGISAGAITGCGPPNHREILDNISSNVYTNNHQQPGLGYYHAPYRAWFPLPYNHYNAETRRYFHGGMWTELPHASVTNIAPPTLEAAQKALSQHPRTQVPRSGFGSTARHHSVYS